jgi:hypothetical protein
MAGYGQVPFRSSWFWQQRYSPPVSLLYQRVDFLTPTTTASNIWTPWFFGGALSVSGTLAATEAGDTAVLTGTVPVGITGTLASTEAGDTAAVIGGVVRAITYWPLSTTGSSLSWGPLQPQGSPPSVASFTTFFDISSNPTSTPFYLSRLTTFLGSSPSATSLLDAATGPLPNVGTSGADSFAIPAPLTGSFASGNWTLTFGIKTNIGSSATGRVRCRVWASVNFDGSSARELTSGALVTNTITLSASLPTFTPSVTWAAPLITLNNEYMFFAVEWEATAVGTGGQDVKLVQNNSALTSTVWTPSVASSFSGTLAATEASDTAALAGILAVFGTLTATEAGDIPSFAGLLANMGTLAATEAADTAALTGTVQNRATLAATEAPDTAAIVGNIAASGALAVTEAGDTAAFSGSLAGAGISGSLAATEASDTAVLTGLLAAFGTLAATEAADTAALTGTVQNRMTLAVTEAPDTAAITGSLQAFGTLTVTEAGDTAALNGTIGAPGLTGTLAATEAPDTAAFNGTVENRGVLAATETADACVITGIMGVLGTLAATEARDTAVINGLVRHVMVLAATEAADTAALTGYTRAVGTLAATEASDSAAFVGDVPALPNGVLSAIEAGDVALFAGRVRGAGTPVPYPSKQDYGWYDHRSFKKLARR